MYDELVKRLRSHANGDFQSKCDCCEFTEDYPPCIPCIPDTENAAADAIEALSKIALDEHNRAAKLTWERRWIPVTERLPKYGERVLVFGGVTMYVAYYDKNRYGGESWHKLNSKSHYCNPTHWMPLPQPPEEETDD